ncbi:hypothetical protein [Enterococcus alishanensis]
MKNVKLLGFSAIVGMGLVIYGGTAADAATNDLFRVYNPNSGEHFFTESTSERNWLVAQGWKYEEVAWATPDQGEAVYRLYNQHTGDHFYTKSVTEYDWLKTQGWIQEGEAFYSDTDKTNPVYRSYNKNAKAGAHMYTTSIIEHNSLISIGWTNEEVSFYAANPGNNTEVVDKDELNAEIANGENISKDDYTEATYQNLATALAAGKKVAADQKATQAEVDAATEAIKTALNSLAPGTVDKTALSAKITEAQNYDESIYTSDTAAALATAITEAQKVFNDAAATQAQVDAQLKNLEDTISALRVSVDPIALQNSINKLAAANTASGNNLVAENYATNTWDTYNAAYQDAVTILAAAGTDPTVTQAKIDTANTTLQESFDNLVFVRNLSDLYQYTMTLSVYQSIVTDEMKAEIVYDSQTMAALDYYQMGLKGNYEQLFEADGRTPTADAADIVTQVNIDDMISQIKETLISNLNIEYDKNQANIIGKVLTISTDDELTAVVPQITVPTINWAAE